MGGAVLRRLLRAGVPLLGLLSIGLVLAVQSASGGGPAEPAVLLSTRESDIESNAVGAGSGGDPKQVEFFGPGAFSDSVSSSDTTSSMEGGSASATGSATEASSVAATSNGLAIDAEVNLSASASASGEQFPDVPMFARGIGDEELDVGFQVLGAPHSFRIQGTRAVPTNGFVDIELRCGGIVVFSRSGAGGGFDEVGTISPGSCSLSVDALADAEDNTAGTVPTSTGGYVLSLDVTEAGAQPPAVEITAGPPATTNATTASFEFRATGGSPPPGHFECSLDNAGFTECASPKTFDNLAEGDHRFQVRYKPDAGGAGPAAEATWRVVPGCPDVRVGVAVAQGCFTERMANGAGTGVFETEQDAWVGGFHLRPRPGGKLVIQDRPQAPLAAEGAGVDWLLGGQAVPAPLAELQPFVPDFTLSLNTAGTIERFVALPLLQGLSAQAKVTWDPGGRGSKVEASVSMEELTESLGTPLAGLNGNATSIGTLAAKLELKLANGTATEVTEGELEVPEYAVELEGTTPPLKEGFGGGRFKAKRVGTTVEWSGEVSVLFPWQGQSGTNQGTVTGRLFFTDFQMGGLGLGVSGFERPIGRTGWDLTGIEGDVLYRPDFAFNVGVTAQQHSSFAGDHLFKLTGNVKALKLAEDDCEQGSNPVEFVGTFNAPPLEAQEIGELKGQVLMCAYLQGARNFAFEAGLSGDLKVDVPVDGAFSAQGSAKGWFSGLDFNLDGSYRLTVPVIGTIGADGVFSSEGYAVCGRYGFISAGIATDNWLEPPGDLTGCDFTPFRVATGPSSARAAGGTRTVRVPSGQSAFGFAVRGSDGAPLVRVSGPRGERFTTPSDGEPLERRDALIIPATQLKTTYVYLRRPRPGRWSIEPLDGSPAIDRVETARQLPRPRVRARARRRGGKVVVNWSARRIPGQRIELVDRADGVATTIQRSTSRGRGRVVFTPRNPLATRRTIEAVILQNGSPRPPLTAARYRLRKPRRPARVGKPTARRTSAGLTIRWRRARRARDYIVSVSAGTSVLTRTTTARRVVTYRGAPAGRLTVRITSRDQFGRTGPAARVTVR